MPMAAITSLDAAPVGVLHVGLAWILYRAGTVNVAPR
jgi:hypothetical protein